MTRVKVFLLSVLVVACGTTTQLVTEEPVALAAPGPGGPWPSVGYWGPHPVPAGYGGGFDYAEGPHTHPYTPDRPDLYAEHDGFFVFVGDPYFYGYAGPMRWYAGPHVLRYPWGAVVCPIDGPHRHWDYASTYVYDDDYVLVDGFWIYVGLWPVWWHHDHVVYLDRYWPGPYHEHYAPYRPRAHEAMQAAPTHHVDGRPDTRPGQPGVHDVPPAGGPGAHPDLKPAFDENRPHRPDPNAPDLSGVTHSPAHAPAPAAEGAVGARPDDHANLPPAWNDGRKAAPQADSRPGARPWQGRNGDDGRQAPAAGTDVRGERPQPGRGGDNDRPASGHGTWQAPTGTTGVRTGTDGQASRPFAPTAVSEPRGPRTDPPTRHEADPRPSSTWGSGRVDTGTARTRPSAPQGDDDSWRKKATQRPSAPAADRGRGGSTGGRGGHRR